MSNPLKPLLSICIPTLVERREVRSKLIKKLYLLASKVDFHVQICLSEDERQKPTGTKRNELYRFASGQYICSIDDDDDIADNYLIAIGEAAKKNPDVITFNGVYYENGEKIKPFNIRLHNTYTDAGTVFLRMPNHLCPIKAHIAKAIKFSKEYWGEDTFFTKKLHESGLLKTEAHINSELYHYYYITTKKRLQ